MGDSRRFELFASLIARNFSRDLRIADVASGKGLLKAALRQRGLHRVTCWDKSRRRKKARPGQRTQLFHWQRAPAGYQLIAAMHPDEATDHCILYAIRHQIPFVICPCCIKPDAASFDGRSDYRCWIRHLDRLAVQGGMQTLELQMPMSGRNVVLIGRPSGRRKAR